MAMKPRNPCTVADCGRPSINGPLCVGHGQQKRMGKALTPLRRKVRSDIRNEAGLKMCSWCDVWKEEVEFYARKGLRDGLSPWCKPCDTIYTTCRKFNISQDRYFDMLSRQGGCCAICGGQSKNGDRLSVDHDHACCPQPGRSCGDCVRGLLCADCNRVLGMMNDDPSRLRAAAEYLEGG